MYYVNYKLIQFYICAKIDSLGSVLHQVNIILHSQIPWENSTNQLQLILESFYQRMRMQWPVLVIVDVRSPSYFWLRDPMSCTPGFPVLHYLPEFAQTHVWWVNDAIQTSHPVSLPSPLALNLSQHQGLFQWVSSFDHVTKVLELQLQHQSFQWIFRVDFL